MKKHHVLLPVLAAAILAGGCATTARRNTAHAAAQYGTDVVVLEKLERGSRLSFADLEELGRRRVPDEVILSHLQRRDDAYRLTTTQVLRLREAGIGDPVIDYLLASPERVAWRARRSYPVWGYHDAFGHHHGFGHWGHGFHGHGGHHW